MKVEIYSRAAVGELIENGFPERTVVISFFSPRKTRRDEDIRVSYAGVCEDVVYVAIHDIDIERLDDYGYTYETYFSNADEAARLVYDAYRNGYEVICQCDFGQSRSAACAAAILEHFEHRGIDVFADYRYYPNQLVFNKMLDALRDFERAEERS